jgi:glycosyltransferase involved in cell wall biosynthesis
MKQPNSTTTQWGWMNERCLYQMLSTAEDIGKYLAEEEQFFRFIFFAAKTDLNVVLEWLARAARARPRDAFHFLCSDEFQAVDLQAAGLSALHVSHNAFLDESLYPVALEEPARRKFDAVCISRMLRLKRHGLAREVPRVLFIGSVVADDDEEAYFQELSAMMPQAEFTHRQKHWLDTTEVAARCAEAAAGLILSPYEGGSYVTTEYMLCGLPVVSTGSVGGRECWLHPRFSRVVPASARAVAEAVAEFKANPVSPHEVRDHALRVMTEQRQRFFQLGQRIYEVENAGRDFARDFYANFRHKMAEWKPNGEVMAEWKGMFGQGNR